MPKHGYVLLALAAMLPASACSNSTNPVAVVSTADALSVLSVLPAAGATTVDPTKPVVLTFNMAMMSGMELLVVVNEGTVTGPQVAGTSTWSTDRRTLTFTPTAALKAKTTYVIHLSPSLTAANGKTIDMSQGMRIGGQTVTAGMMGSAAGGMMNGSWGSGMMGAGWKASDGTFGMLFTFTTA